MATSRSPSWRRAIRRRRSLAWVTRSPTGCGRPRKRQPRPLALFDAVRVDFLAAPPAPLHGHLLAHDPALDPLHQLSALCGSVRAVGAGGVGANRRALYGAGAAGRRLGAARRLIARTPSRSHSSAPWERFQMPAYNPRAATARAASPSSISASGPPTPRTSTDHLAVLRPTCWLMIGHCGGLRQIADASATTCWRMAISRRDRILDDLVPPGSAGPGPGRGRRSPCRRRRRDVTGERGDGLKRRLRTGTVVTLCRPQLGAALDAGTTAASIWAAPSPSTWKAAPCATQGYRLRVPYGTLLCVSDKPLHGEIKLPGAATAFYKRAVERAPEDRPDPPWALRSQLGSLHSRKLRSFDEPPFQ